MAAGTNCGPVIRSAQYAWYKFNELSTKPITKNAWAPRQSPRTRATPRIVGLGGETEKQTYSLRAIQRTSGHTQWFLEIFKY